MRRAIIAALLALAVGLTGCSSLISGQAITGPGQPTTSVTSPATTRSPRSPTTPARPQAPATTRLAPPTSAGTVPTAPPKPPQARTVPSLTNRYDAATDALLAQLDVDLRTGRRAAFLSWFDPSLVRRVGHWFDNIRRLGVSAADFAQMDGYSISRSDSASQFARYVAVGVRTPYDNTDSMPAIDYTLTATVEPAKEPVITGWQPTYVDDPMNCDCTFSVAHSASVAVVYQADAGIGSWPQEILAEAAEAIPWTRKQAAGVGLRNPLGQVIFLADRPFRWFVDSSSTPEQSNATITMVDADGASPGVSLSTQSRIVLLLAFSDGGAIADTSANRLYTWDVVTHESTHQLMNENSHLDYYDSADPIQTWMVEGIAVAVETLHRRDHPETRDIGYPQPDDPANISRSWLRQNFTGALPTTEDLYVGPARQLDDYYALAGSVYLFADSRYGYVGMLRIADQVYARDDQNPFMFFPDTAHPGRFLSISAATAAWQKWFRATYLD